MPLLPPANVIMVRVATIAAAVALGLACSHLAVLLLPGGDRGYVLRPLAVRSAPVSAAHPPLQYANMQKWHLFGQPVAEEDVKKVNVEPIVAPETRLNLELQGTVCSESPTESMAIISEPGKPQKTYHLGDELPGNATLYAVEPAHVILQRNGRHETLSLRKPTERHTALRENSPPTRSFPLQANQKSM